jgi:hypothetical protein
LRTFTQPRMNSTLASRIAGNFLPFAPGDCKPGWPAHLNSRAASSKLRNRRNAVRFPERSVNEDPEN